jgi:hypothetical protein
VPALPALALCLAPALPRRPTLAAAAFGAGVALVGLAAGAPRALHNRADGEGALLRFLAPPLDLDSRLPTFVVDDPSAPLLAATAAGAGALCWLLGWRGLLAGALGYAVIASGLKTSPLLEPRAATLELLARWDETNLRSAGARLDPGALHVPVELPHGPWALAPDEIRNSRPLDLPPGVYEAKVEGRVVEALRTARVARLDLVAGGLLLERRYLREDQALAPIELVLPVGARRLTLTAVGIQGRGVIEGAAIVPRALVRRSEREAFSWPRDPREDRYRLESDGVRVTALDPVIEAAFDFLVEGSARFVVEAAPGSTIRVSIVREQPSERDALVWRGRRVLLQGAASLDLELPADDGLDLAGRRLVPVLFEARGRIRFSSSAPAPRP